MRKVIEFFLKRSSRGITTISVVLMLGLFYACSMKTSSSELETNKISITVRYPGASPEEVDEDVTTKIEQALKDIKGIEQIKSSSSESLSQISVHAYHNTEIETLLNEVEIAVNAIQSLPEDAEQPIIELSKKHIGTKTQT